MFHQCHGTRPESSGRPMNGGGFQLFSKSSMHSRNQSKNNKELDMFLTFNTMKYSSEKSDFATTSKIKESRSSVYGNNTHLDQTLSLEPRNTHVID